MLIFSVVVVLQTLSLDHPVGGSARLTNSLTDIVSTCTYNMTVMTSIHSVLREQASSCECPCQGLNMAVALISTAERDFVFLRLSRSIVSLVSWK